MSSFLEGVWTHGALHDRLGSIVWRVVEKLRVESGLRAGSVISAHIRLQIVRQHLGDHAVSICGYLVRRPRRTLKELQGDTDLPLGQLRNCLLVLVQHNLVPPPGRAGRAGCCARTRTRPPATRNCFFRVWELRTFIPWDPGNL